MVSKTFSHPEDINYTVVTGHLFRPFFCLSHTAAVAEIITSKVIALSFFAKTANGAKNIPWVNLQANQQAYLGILKDSQYYSTISTENCFVMEDGNEIQMGGLGTSH